ncbi:MAG: MFS transporter [Clostridia bacterium]
MKLDYKRTLLVGLAFLSICAFWQLYDNVVPLILKFSFHMPDDAAGVIMALDNVLALFMLPLFGKLSDKSHTRLGKRMPYIVGGTAAAVVLMNLLPIADKSMNLPLFIAALALLLIAMGTYRAPAVALMPDVTPKALRSKGNAIINLMGGIGRRVYAWRYRLFGAKGHGQPKRLYAAVFGSGYFDGGSGVHYAVHRS